MSNNYFALVGRMKYITRWSLMRNSVSENIQEHSHMVAVIAHALGLIRREIFVQDCNTAYVPGGEIELFEAVKSCK